MSFPLLDPGSESTDGCRVPVPDYQTLMLPTLERFADGNEHDGADIRAHITTQFALTDADLAEMLPSGTQRFFVDRVHWALWYLQRSGLTVRSRRGVHRITDRGRELLAKKPTRIDAAVLAQYPEYRALRGTPGARMPRSPQPVAKRTFLVETPDALLERAYAQHRTALEEDLLERLKAVTPLRFEAIVIELLVAMGYGGSFAEAAQRIGRTGDGGLDGIIKEDRLGLDVICVQAKRWKGTVGRPDVQAFAGSLQGVRARKGIFITTSSFSKEAVTYVNRIDTRIVLMDGPMLAKLLFEHDTGVTASKEQVYSVKRIDGDFFEED